MSNRSPLGKKIIVIFAALLGFVLPSAAMSESLIDVLQWSLSNDPDLTAAKHERMAELEARPQSRAKLFPTIKLHSRAGKAYENVHETWVNSNFLGTSISNDLRLSLSLNQPIFNLPNFRNLKLADIKLSQAELNYSVALQALLIRTAQHYFNVLAAADSLNFARATKNAIARQLQQSKHRFEIGLIAVTEVHESQARHDLALADEMKAEAILANQKEALRRITDKTPLRLMTLINDMPLTPPTPTNMENWIASAKNSNLQIAAKKLQSELLRQEMEVIRASNYPTLDFNVKYGYNEYGGAYRSTTLDGLATVDFNMTLYEGNISSSKLSQKKHQLRRSQQLTEAKEREVLQETRNAYLGVLTGMSYVKALEQALKSSVRALKSIKAGFEVGTRSAKDVLNAQQALSLGRKNYSLARYDYVMNTLRLKVAVGLLSIEDIKQVNSWLQ